ncbi:hypothetical protein Hanom_Chr06g00573531 [Helianthus anomalus]
MNRRCFTYSFPHILGFLSFSSFPLCRHGYSKIFNPSIRVKVDWKAMPEPTSDCRLSDGDTTMFYRSVSLSGFWSKHRDDVGRN